MPRAIALFSGGLDSMLAARLVQDFGIEVQLLHFSTPFTRRDALAERSAAELKLPLRVVPAGDDYLQLLAEPRFGRCEGAAPCLDCREHLFRRAAGALIDVEADFIVTGEVLGQRRWGQRRRDFEALPLRAGLANVVERPLSGKLLPPTLAQQRGWIDREQLHSIAGAGRREQLELARHYGLEQMPPLARCCELAVEKVGNRLMQIVEAGQVLDRLTCELMILGKHSLVGGTTHLVLSRHAREASELRELATRFESEHVALLEPAGFLGPLGLLQGAIGPEALAAAGQAVRQHAKDAPDQAEFMLMHNGRQQRVFL
jgi:tRNA-uridine 2-sulfurtransferase